MTFILLIEQLLNGLQLGVMLFLMAAGLTLTFGVMRLINLAHGSVYMMGAYFAVTLAELTGSFFIALPVAFLGAVLLGVVIEAVAMRPLYDRDHLDQVLATFGLILFFTELARVVWGTSPLDIRAPEILRGHVEILPEIPYPVYRLAISGVGLAVAGFLYFMISKSRIGMLIRAGASNREMVAALGIRIKLLYTLIFGLGAGLAGLAGTMAGPILSVSTEMWEEILILTFVVVIIGGLGSIRGAFYAAILVGVLDTLGRVFLPEIFGSTAGPAIAKMVIYILMVVVLYWRPAGLFPATNE